MYSYDRTEPGTAKRAALQDGPVGRVLERYWNLIHDLEYNLEKAAQEYDSAASYTGGPAVRYAKEMMADITKCRRVLEQLADSGGVFDKLVRQEGTFVREFAEPSAYADAQRKQMFPR